MEILIVITIFAVLGMIVTRSVILTLQGSQKSESMVSARENLDYSMGIIERQIRNADAITSACNSTSSNSISYLDQDGIASSFACSGGSISSGSAILTNSNVAVTSCHIFKCIPSSFGPPEVDIDITVQNKNTMGILGSAVSASTQIFLRDY